MNVPLIIGEGSTDAAAHQYPDIFNETTFALPLVCDKETVNAAAFANIARGECALHIVNNGASCEAVISGFPEGAGRAIVRVTNTEQNSVAACYGISDGCLKLEMPADSFVSIFAVTD